MLYRAFLLPRCIPTTHYRLFRRLQHWHHQLDASSLSLSSPAGNSQDIVPSSDGRISIPAQELSTSIPMNSDAPRWTANSATGMYSSHGAPRCNSRARSPGRDVHRVTEGKKGGTNARGYIRFGAELEGWQLGLGAAIVRIGKACILSLPFLPFVYVRYCVALRCVLEITHVSTLCPPSSPLASS
ncbi:hypothetical protein BDQ17DRAFT_880711 [Cyathus striatus]|nr:hypothetical protein BDQ17DRAFT_880711 [Cyathus striatus]